MSNTLLQRSFKTLKCDHQGHQSQPLSYICISSLCECTPLMCYLCSLQYHEEHQKIALKIFLKQLLSIQTKSQKVVPLCAEIDNIFQTINNQLKSCSSNFAYPQIIFKTFEQFRSLNIAYALSFYNLVQKVTDLFSQASDRQIAEKLNGFVKNYYFKYFSEIQQNQWNKLDISQNLLTKKIESLNATLQGLLKLKITHKLNDNEVLNLFPLGTQEHKKLKVYFSDDMKPNNMIIMSPTQAKVDKSGSERLIALQPCLSKNMSLKKWGVKIIKLASWIGVGVCHINQIKKANWMFNYTNTGHGNYMISSNGYSWSSYKKQFNSKFQPFTFTTGDIIHVEYDPRQHIVRWKKQSDPLGPTYQLQVQQNDDPIHPQINMTGLNDQVQIINF